MRFRSIQYYIIEAFRNLVKNRVMTIASLITVAACILIMSSSVCIAVNLDAAISQSKSSVNFSVYIKNDLDADKLTTLYNKIKAMPHVKSIRFISHEEAIEHFGKQIENEAVVQGLEGTDALPRSFDLDIDDVQFQKDLVAQINALKSEGVEAVVYDEGAINFIITLSNVVRIVSVVVVLGLLLLAVIIIINTIKIAVNSRKTEISIMKYVGATDWFIRWPFIIEGLMIGLIGSAVPAALSWVIYDNLIASFGKNYALIGGLMTFMSGIRVFSMLMPLSIITGCAIGIIGSLTSLRRYLNV